MKCILVPEAVFDGVARAVLDLHEDLTYVFAYYAEGHEDEAAEKPYREHDRRPSADGTACEVRSENPHGNHYVDQQEHKSDDEYQTHGLGGERCDSINGGADHLSERIFRFAGDAPCAWVADDGRLQPDVREDAPQEKVAFGIFGKQVKGTAAHEPVFRMVEHRFESERVLEAVECPG